MMPTVETIKEAYRAAKDKQQYRGLSQEEVEAQKARVGVIGNVLNKAIIQRLADA